MTMEIATIRRPIATEFAGEDPGDFHSLPLAEGTAPEAKPSVEPASLPMDVAAIIARLDARNADIIRHSAEVLTYERKRPPVSMVGRETRSQRPMCGGCGFGIRKETRQVEGPNGVYHPNCAKVAAGLLDSTKVSPRYLAAVVPLTQIRLRALSAPAPVVAEVPSEVEVPQTETVEDVTTDLVAEAVAQTEGRGRGKRRSTRSA
jgi:hypothetical protein